MNGLYPPTRFMGSKEALLDPLSTILCDLGGTSVLDLFSGSGVVSHRLKVLGKAVVSNDQMAMCAAFTQAMVANDSLTLSPRQIASLTSPRDDGDGFVAATFQGLYFSDADNRLIDGARAAIRRLRSSPLRALARTALIRACLKKRPRGIFTYTGMRYDDGRRDLRLSLADHIAEQAAAVNAAVFTGAHPCLARHGDALSCADRADVVYMDPPYFSPLSDNEYVRRYHFLEGLARDWKGVEIQWHTKTRKFARYPTPFGTADGAVAAFERLFQTHADAAIVVSYSSNALPDRDALTTLMKRFKRHVDVVDLPHRYSVGTQKSDQRNAVQEYLFIGT